MIFLTVGTQFPFDRLVKAVDRAVERSGLSDEIFAQIGNSSYKPKNFEYAVELEKSLFDKYFSEANGIISHAGMGTITMALERKKPLLVMPRLKKYGEVVNNHQVDVAGRFEKLGYLLVTHCEEDLPEKMQQLAVFVPRERHAQSEAVAKRIFNFLQELSVSGR